MRRQRSANLLMITSQTVLAVFLTFWLMSQYRNEKRELRDKLLVKLSDAQTKATDSSILHEFILPLLERGITTSSSKTEIHFDYRSPNLLSSLMSLGDDKFRQLKNASSPDTVRSTNLQFHFDHDTVRTNTIEEHNGGDKSSAIDDTSQALIRHGVELIIGKTATLADSTQLMILKGDTATMRRYFQQSLNESGMPFTLGWNDSILSDLRLPVGYILSDERDFLSVRGYEHYVLRRLWPQAVFALVLLGITGAAFLLAYRSLRQQRRLSIMKEELVSNMSHELKTPVATVKVALEALGDEEVLNDRQTVRDYLRMAAAEVVRLELLINQTLHTSLLEQGRMRISRSMLDLRQLLQTVVYSVQLRAEESAITLTFSGDDWRFSGDALHLQGVVLNLLDNARKYAGSGAVIKVNAESGPEEVKIIISDNGPGISEEYLKKIFDKFFRVPTSNRHDVKGYGLGLSYAAQVVLQHGGTIQAANILEGGVAFSIVLPRESPAS